ncbi:LysE family transporter [Pelagibius sp. CAU 1746]|uniref:LysE family translocator n=1 Tax=Pelagibius sp. CAU 1746 TaxID=3140370 RepID=UPI00325A8333
MMLGDLGLLWLAALPLMGSPGPATLSTAAVGSSFGPRRGLPYLAGIIAGTADVLLLIATGVTAAILAVPALATAITLAAAYTLYLAWRIATAPPLSKDTAEAKAPAFPGGFFLAIANPKAFAVLGAVYARHSVIEGDLATDAVVKVAALSLVIVLVNSTWLVFGSMIAALLHDPRKARITNIAFAVLLVASVALALL